MKRLMIALYFILFVAACSNSPMDVYKTALKAVEEQNKEDFINLFTAKSQNVLKNINKFQAIIKNHDLTFIKNPFSLLPKFKDLSKVKVKTKGNYALITNGKRRHPTEIVLLKEGGKWKIVLFELQKFWSKLK